MTTEARAWEVRAPGATEEELAALVAVLTVRLRPGALTPSTDRPLAGGWTSYYRTVRQQTAPGGQAWRTSIRF